MPFIRRKILFFLIYLVVLGSFAATDDPYKAQRLKMVKEQIDAETVSDDRQGVSDPHVLSAMRAVPRHEFVPRRWRGSAYADYPLPIGYDQTISQPYIVAFMTELLQPKPEHKALEVGTGSGYQAAVLSQIIKQVFSIEIIKELAESAKERLKKLKYENVEVRAGDGYYGWEEHAPYDLIIVTAATSHIPPPLIRQLKPGGRMVIPVGSPFHVQDLMLLQKTEKGQIKSRSIIPVRFVPLTGKH